MFIYAAPSLASPRTVANQLKNQIASEVIASLVAKQLSQSDFKRSSIRMVSDLIASEIIPKLSTQFAKVEYVSSEQRQGMFDQARLTLAEFKQRKYQSSSQYDHQLVIQLDNQENTKQAARFLVNKHPSQSELVQFDGTTFSTLENPISLSNNSRVILVGNGSIEDGTRLFAHLNSQMLSSNLANYLKSRGNTDISRVSLVGCRIQEADYAINQSPSYSASLLEGLKAENINVKSISARTALVKVDEYGRKLTGELSGNEIEWSSKDTRNKVIVRFNEVGQVIYDKLPVSRGEVVKINEVVASEALDIPQGIQDGLAYAQSRILVEKLNTATEELYQGHNLSNDWIIDLSSVKKNNSGEGYQIRFINSAAETEQWISTDKSVFALYKSKYESALHNSSIHLEQDTNGNFSLSTQGINIDIPDALSEAIFVKALFEFNNVNDRQSSLTNQSPPILQTAIKLHTYLHLAQGGLNTAHDIYKVYAIIKSLSHDALSEGHLFTKISTVVGKVDVGLNALNIVFDAIELANAQTPEQRAVFGTQLAFDAAGLGIAGVSYGLGLAGASTASAFVGSLAVPLAGVGICVTSLVCAIEQAQGQAIAMAHYFWQYDKDYTTPYSEQTLNHHEFLDLGFAEASVDEHGQLQAKRTNQAIIKSINLANENETTLQFDSQYVYKTRGGVPGGWWTGGIHSYDHDKTTAINIRTALEHDETYTIHKDFDSVILPLTPKSYIRYGYGATWGITWRNDAELKVTRKIQKNAPFYFEQYVADEEAVRSLHFEYVPTDISLTLGARPTSLVTPAIPQEWYNKLNYIINGNGDHYTIRIAEGASYQIHPSTSTEVWMIDASSIAHDNTPEINSNGQMTIGRTKVSITGSAQTVLVKTSDGSIFNYNTANNSLVLEGVNAVSWQQHHKQESLVEYIESEKQKPHHAGYIRIDNYTNSQGDNVTAWYDANKNRYIELNHRVINEPMSHIQLLGVNEKDIAFFSSDSHVYVQNINTDEATVIDTHSSEISNIKYNDKITTIRFVDGISLAVLDNENKYITQIRTDEVDIDSIHRLLTSVAAEVNYKFADAILIDQAISNLKNWYIPKTGEIVTSNINNSRLLGWEQAQGNYTYFVYDFENKRLYRQVSGSNLNTIEPNLLPINIENLKEVYTTNHHVFAHTSNGNVFRVDSAGKLYLSGVWLTESDHKHILLADLLRHESSDQVIQLLGINNFSGTTAGAWYDSINDVLITSASDIDAEHTSYIGYDKYSKTAYLLDHHSARLYSTIVEPGNINAYALNFDNDKPVLENNFNGPLNVQSVNFGINVKLAYLNAGKLIVVSDTGIIFDASMGDLSLIGVTDQWVDGQSVDLEQALINLKGRYQKHNPILTVGSHNRYAWFSTENDRLFEVPPQVHNGTEVRQTLIGYDAEQYNTYTFSKEAGLIYRTLNTNHAPLFVRDEPEEPLEYASASFVTALESTLIIFGDNIPEDNRIIPETITFKPPKVDYSNLVYITSPSANEQIIISPEDFVHFDMIFIDTLDKNSDINQNTQYLLNGELSSQDSYETLQLSSLESNIAISDSPEISNISLKFEYMVPSQFDITSAGAYNIITHKGTGKKIIINNRININHIPSDSEYSPIPHVEVLDPEKTGITDYIAPASLRHLVLLSKGNLQTLDLGPDSNTLDITRLKNNINFFDMSNPSYPEDFYDSLLVTQNNFHGLYVNGAYSLIGTNKVDRLYRSGGCESQDDCGILLGNDGNDYISVEKGSYLLSGGRGNDEIRPGLDSDLIHYFKGDGVDRITHTTRRTRSNPGVTNLNGDGLLLDNINSEDILIQNILGTLIIHFRGQPNDRIEIANWGSVSNFVIGTTMGKKIDVSGINQVIDLLINYSADDWKNNTTPLSPEIRERLSNIWQAENL